MKPPRWLVKGARVDYRSFDTGAVQPNMLVRIAPFELASGRWICWLEGVSDSVNVNALTQARTGFDPDDKETVPEPFEAMADAQASGSPPSVREGGDR